MHHFEVPVSLLAAAAFCAKNFRAAHPRGTSLSTGGNAAGGIKKCSGTLAPASSALAIMVKACPALGGVMTVAVNCPVRTQAWPVLGTPSQPVMGMPSH